MLPTLSFPRRAMPAPDASPAPQIGHPPLLADDLHTSLPALTSSLAQYDAWRTQASNRPADLVALPASVARALLDLAIAQLAGRVATVQFLTHGPDATTDRGAAVRAIGTTSANVSAATDRIIEEAHLSRATMRAANAVRLFQASRRGDGVPNA